jgi:hypothetical protein
VGVADWITSIAAICAVPLVTVLVARSARRATAEQEMLKALRQEVTDSETQSTIRLNYIYELRAHIFAGKGEPPPPVPDGLKL